MVLSCSMYEIYVGMYVRYVRVDCFVQWLNVTILSNKDIYIKKKTERLATQCVVKWRLVSLYMCNNKN